MKDKMKMFEGTVTTTQFGFGGFKGMPTQTGFVQNQDEGQKLV